MERKIQYCQDVSILSLMYRFNTIPIKTSASYFVDFNQLILAYMEKQMNQDSQQNTEEEQS